MAAFKENLLKASELLDVDPDDLQTALDTEQVRYEIHADDSHSRGVIRIPSWATGDPQATVALYFFGYVNPVSRSFVTKAEVL